MDRKIKTAVPSGISRADDEGSESGGFIGSPGFGILLAMAETFDRMKTGFYELPSAARENFGLAVFFAFAGVAVLPELKYLFFLIFGIPFAVSLFAAGFLTVAQLADEENEPFAGDSEMWIRRTLVLSVPAATLGIFAAAR